MKSNDMTKSRLLVLLGVAAILLGCLLGGRGIAALAREVDPRRSTWEALPDETIFAARIPGARAFARALRERTKLGAVLFSEDRCEKFMSVIRRHDLEGWEAFVGGLLDVHLEPSDLVALFRGESGVAVLVDQEGGPDPLIVGIGWMDPGEELAIRTYDAVARAIDEATGAPEAPRRVDLELEQCPVMHLRIPKMKVSMEVTVPDDFGQMTDEAKRQFMEEWMNSPDDPKQRHLAGHVNVMMARMEGRLIVVTTFDPEDREASVVSARRLSSLLAKCLAAHRDDGAGFVARMASTAGLSTVIPQDGLGGFEAYADLPRLIRMAAREEAVAPIIDAIGLGGVGPMAMRLVLDGTVFRSTVFVEVPVPRSGIVKIIEQKEIEAAPPPWVPREVLSYGHLSADLGAIYRQVKATVLAIRGQAAETAFGMAEAWAFGFAQADLPTTLSAFGHRHMFLQFAADIAGEDGPAVRDDFALMQRFGVVWQVQDADVLQRLVAAAVSMMQGDTVEKIEKQDYQGWRFQEGAMVVDLMIGKSHMVLAIGDGVMETVLTALDTPPYGEASLLGSGLFEEAGRVIDLQPGVMFQVTDGARSSMLFNATVKAGFAQGIAEVRHDGISGNGGQKVVHVLEEIQDLLPTDEQWRGMIGVSGGSGYVNDRGVVMKSSVLLPPP